MKLKTLKDLDIFKTYKKLLRQVAIKQVKFFLKNEDSTGFQVSMAYDYKITDIKGTINWIKWFFNITREDLK
ncbi:hypothetical protein LCGC14_1987950 [marine sediment metagenome]|uniref:Uncharacterized protein n=1 Tax=marine sediment metagenome TaxID=412755 RepID=A0A0F9C838_9ZZZZ